MKVNFSHISNEHYLFELHMHKQKCIEQFTLIDIDISSKKNESNFCLTYTQIKEKVKLTDVQKQIVRERPSDEFRVKRGERKREREREREKLNHWNEHPMRLVTFLTHFWPKPFNDENSDLYKCENFNFKSTFFLPFFRIKNGKGKTRLWTLLSFKTN